MNTEPKFKHYETIGSWVFAPYSSYDEPRFVPTLWDTYKRDEYGKFRLAYRLRQSVRDPTILFEGEDFFTPNAVDSNQTVAAIMNFLCLKPGDTDSEYFEHYTPAQLEFATTHGETLWCEVAATFGEEACA
jgi:hypothetical protein